MNLKQVNTVQEVINELIKYKIKMKESYRADTYTFKKDHWYHAELKQGRIDIYSDDCTDIITLSEKDAEKYLYPIDTKEDNNPAHKINVNKVDELIRTYEEKIIDYENKKKAYIEKLKQSLRKKAEEVKQGIEEDIFKGVIPYTKISEEEIEKSFNMISEKISENLMLIKFLLGDKEVDNIINLAGMEKEIEQLQKIINDLKSCIEE